MNYCHTSGVDWVLITLGLVLVAILFAALAFWFFSVLRLFKQNRQTQEFSAREILDRRLAQGEITFKQYSRLRKATEESS